MGKLNDLVTTALSGEAVNYGHYETDGLKSTIKQTFNVSVDYENFKWTVKSELYLKIERVGETSYTQIQYDNMWIKIGNNKKIIGSGSYKVSEYSTFKKIGEYQVTYECYTGWQGVRLSCGYLETYYYDDYTLIYLTLPAFSGIRLKIDDYYTQCMPLIKVNGEWKRALQWIKVNGEWKKYTNSDVHKPED